ncbi:hypothetical protein E2C01_097917 [Portunus trituberculatus]|uniref:Uncharacterized protein n=1 Tax=Portunus trituberculatus TaxID=210409 RepID=A0A5B7K5M0_PORTR|nr:hypothetical protein [Portunus trituberculatus]
MIKPSAVMILLNTEVNVQCTINEHSPTITPPPPPPPPQGALTRISSIPLILAGLKFYHLGGRKQAERGGS